MPWIRRSRRWSPRLLGLGVLSFALGQAIWAYYEIVAHQQPPFPSWAYAGYLAAYPLMLGGILLLPARPIPLAAHARATRWHDDNDRRGHV